MQKKETFNFEDSNIALLNSKLHKDVRLAAAQSEAAWKGCGQAPGIEVWRIEKFKVKAWEKKNYGKFCTGDSYIVLYTYRAKDAEGKDTDKLKYNVHFWLGSETSQDEAGTAAYKTVELDDYLGDVPVQFREVQGWESDQFRALFPSMEYMAGGVDTGFSHVKAAEYSARLLQVKGKQSVRISEVPLSTSSLNDGDVFILDNGLKLWQWNGNQSSVFERRQADQVIRDIKLQRSSKPTSSVLDGLEDDAVFWKLLGGKPSVIAPAVDDADVEACKRLLKISDKTGKLTCSKVAEGSKIKINLLDSNDVFILDEGYQVYVWVGKGASAEERKNAMVSAVNYLGVAKKPNHTPIIRIMEGADCHAFEQAFDHSTPRTPNEIETKNESGNNAGAVAKAGIKGLPPNTVRGMLKITVHSAKDLPDTQLLGKQDPYCRLKYDGKVYKTNVHDNGNLTPVWDEKVEFALGLADDPDVELDVMNKGIVFDTRIGSTALTISSLVAKKSGIKVEFPLHRKVDESAGTVSLSWTIVPPLRLVFESGSELRKVQMLGTQDPYVKVRVANQWDYRGPVAENGGVTPVWGPTNEFAFNVALIDPTKAALAVKGGSPLQQNGKYFVEVTVKDENVIRDTVIGYVRVALDELESKRGASTATKYRLQKTDVQEGFAGYIHIKVL